MTPRFALDIGPLKEHDGYLYWPKAGARASPYADRFAELMRGELRGFTGRDWILADFEKFRSATHQGYFCVTAEAGLGKTALSAAVAHRYKALPFFFSEPEDRTRLEGCLRHLATMAAARYRLDEDRLPAGPMTGWEALTALLGEARRVARRRPLLIVLDAVDEATTQGTGNALALPMSLPEGVHVFLTSRHDVPLETHVDTRIKRFDFSADDERHKADIEAFVARQIGRFDTSLLPEPAAADRRVLAEKLCAASAGNFKYLTYVLADLKEDPSLLSQKPDWLPERLTGYYERFWRSMAAVGEADGQREKDWNELFRPTLTLLGAARQPVTAAWLAQLVKERSAAEIERRALLPWRRFLRRQRRRGGDAWHIVHRSFADFLAEHHAVELDAAHRKIADHYLELWGGLERRLVRLPSPPGERDLYGWHHVVEHLLAAGDTHRLARLVELGRWYHARAADDPSGTGYQADLMLAWRSIETENQKRLAAGNAPEAMGLEVRYALAVTSINSLSENLPAPLLMELVRSGRWRAATGLAAARLNPDPTERDRALAALAPHLDRPLVEEALKLAREAGSISALVRRLVELGEGHRVLSEIALGEGDAGWDIVGALADCLPDAVRATAAARAWSASRRRRAVSVPDSALDALTRLLRHGDPALLTEWTMRADPSADHRILKATAARWAELGSLPEAERTARRITDAEDRAVALAAVVAASCRHPAVEPALETRRLAESVVDDLERMDVPYLFECSIVRDLLPALPPERQLPLLRSVLPRSGGSFVSYVLGTILLPVLPRTLVDETIELASKLPHDDRVEVIPSIAARLAELGAAGAAIDLARQAGDRYQRGEAMIKLLPVLATHGAAAQAVAALRDFAAYGQEQQFPSALAAVGRALRDVEPLEEVRRHAAALANEHDRRRVRRALAPAYAAIGKAEEALSLARSIDDGDVQDDFRLWLALAWTDALKSPGEALARLPSLRAWHRRASLIRHAAAFVSLEQAKRLLDQARAQYRAEPGHGGYSYTCYHEALTALLRRCVQLGAVEHARAFAREEADDHRYLLEAEIANCLPADEAATALASLVTELLRAPFEHEHDRSSVKWDLIDCMSGTTLLRAVESYEADERSRGRPQGWLDWTEHAASRLIDGGLVREGIELARRRLDDDYGTYGMNGLLGRAAGLLDADEVRNALEKVGSSCWEGSQEEAMPALLGRLAELGHVAESWKRALALEFPEVALKAMAAVVKHLPAGFLAHALDAACRLRSELDDVASSQSFESFCVALSHRYAVLGDFDLALSMLQADFLSDHEKGEALAALAPLLSETALRPAIDAARELWQLQGAALAALLPRYARRDVASARQALAWADGVSDARERASALSSLSEVLMSFPMPERHALWSAALHAAARRQRGHFLADLRALLPIAAASSGGRALLDIERSLADVAERWP
jgi:hypothetical protein